MRLEGENINQNEVLLQVLLSNSLGKLCAPLEENNFFFLKHREIQSSWLAFVWFWRLCGLVFCLYGTRKEVTVATTVVSEAYNTSVHLGTNFRLGIVTGHWKWTVCIVKSCGSEAKRVNTLILDIFKILLLKMRGKKEELRNQVLSSLQKKPHKITVRSVIHLCQGLRLIFSLELSCGF